MSIFPPPNFYTSRFSLDTKFSQGYDLLHEKQILIILDSMNVDKFTLLIERMTGSPIRFGHQSSEAVLLEKTLENLSEINWNQFNELLLLCNKDRVSEGFFDLFFRNILNIPDKFTPIEKIEQGVEEFRKYAMLGFGNFRFAYRELSKLPKNEIINKKELKIYLKESKEIISEFKNRPEKVHEIYPISEKDTYLVGYLSGTTIGVNLGSAILIKDAIKEYKGSKEGLLRYIEEHTNKNIEKIDKSYRKVSFI